jgi:hypothetical protein
VRKWVVLSGVLAPVLLYGQVGLGLSPLRLEVGMAGGAVHSGPLAVSNESSSAIRVRAELLDFYIDDSGTPQFARAYPAEAENSCREWLSLNPRETEVPPKSSVTVRYTLRVPPGASSRSYHCAAGFTTQATAGQLGGMGLQTAVRMVAAFYVLVGNPAIEGEIEGVTVEPLPDSGAARWRAVVLVRNWGHKYFRPSGELELLDDSGSVVESHPFPSLPVLPNRRQRFLFPLAAAPEPHPYKLRVRVDMGAEEIQEATVTVRPPSSGP